NILSSCQPIIPFVWHVNGIERRRKSGREKTELFREDTVAECHLGISCAKHPVKVLTVCKRSPGKDPNKQSQRLSESVSFASDAAVNAKNSVAQFGLKPGVSVPYAPFLIAVHSRSLLGEVGHHCDNWDIEGAARSLQERFCGQVQCISSSAGTRVRRQC